MRRHAWLPLLRFYCFLALSLLWQHLSIMWAERPWPKTLLSHPSQHPQTPDCEKSLGESYGSSGLLSAGRPERRSVLGVLWSHSFHSLSGFVSTRPQQHNSPLRGKHRERERGWREGRGMGQITPMSLKAKAFRRQKTGCLLTLMCLLFMMMMMWEREWGVRAWEKSLISFSTWWIPVLQYCIFFFFQTALEMHHLWLLLQSERTDPDWKLI